MLGPRQVASTALSRRPFVVAAESRGQRFGWHFRRCCFLHAFWQQGYAARAAALNPAHARRHADRLIEPAPSRTQTRLESLEENAVSR